RFRGHSVPGWLIRSGGGRKPMSRRVLIMGAAGRDFHNFNVAYRDSANHEVVAFTATQVPFIARRGYPPVLAGPRDPAGSPDHPGTHLDRRPPHPAHVDAALC